MPEQTSVYRADEERAFLGAICKERGFREVFVTGRSCVRVVATSAWFTSLNDGGEVGDAKPRTRQPYIDRGIHPDITLSQYWLIARMLHSDETGVNSVCYH